MTIRYKIWGEEISEKVIVELSEDDLEGKTLLGAAFGHGDLHCLSMASRHCRNFSDRVSGYRRITPPKEALDNGCGIAIEFYE